MSVVFDQNSPLVWLPITAFLIACAANGVAYLIGYAHGTKNSKIDAILNAQRAERETEREQARGHRRRTRESAPALTRHSFQPVRPGVGYPAAETAVLQTAPATDDLELVAAGDSRAPISEQRRVL
jgi:hypothetical protein